VNAEYHVLYIFVICPFCGTKIWGTWKDIDSGLRHHLDFADCDEEVSPDTADHYPSTEGE